MKKELLPIGSVVLLEGGTKTLMITGYKMKEKADDAKVYDYVACVFPEGFMEQIYSLFDANQIKDVLFVGCMDGATDFIRSIEQGVSNIPIGVAPENSVIPTDSSNRASRKPPTKPLSKSEMRAKYTREVISGGQSKIFDIDAYQDHDFNDDIIDN